MTDAAPVVGLATCAALPGLCPDDRHLLAALRARGLAAEPVVWEERYYDWQAFDLIVIRSTWDYAVRHRQFLGWAKGIGHVTRFAPDPALVVWNSHKGYLLELAERDVPVVPTELIAAASELDLADLLAQRGWEEAVLKPAVGAAGRWVTRCKQTDAAAVKQQLSRLFAHEDVLVQPWCERVVQEGELSVVCIDGQVTHAVRKRAAAGDFLVHDDYGGGVQPCEPDPDELRLAEQTMAAIDGEPLFGRVDIIRAADGALLVSELELIEPELFFRFSEEALTRMCDGIAARLAAEGP